MTAIHSAKSKPATQHALAVAFKYCPHCGEPSPPISPQRCLHCQACGFTFYFNSAAASGAFVFYAGQLVLCVRGRDPGQGMLDVPGGFVDAGERVEDGLRREIREELGIEVGDLHYLGSQPNDYSYGGVPYKTTDLFFVCEAVSIAGIRAADDVGDVVLLRPEDVDPAAFAFDSTRQAFACLWHSGHLATGHLDEQPILSTPR
jgi:ADP-ribose pyrophosphatase YjhB (NUDIX family)